MWYDPAHGLISGTKGLGIIRMASPTAGVTEMVQ